MKNRASPYGFTLIELLVVIGIISILAALLLFAMSRSQQQKCVMQATKEVRDLKAAAEQYQQDFGQYPPDTGVFATGALNLLPRLPAPFGLVALWPARRWAHAGDSG